jgi:hypothetical protein
MADSKKKIYNLLWGEHEHPAWIELYIWRHYDECLQAGGQLLERWMHMKNAVRILFPEKFTIQRGAMTYEQRGYLWNEWTDIRCKSLCNGDKERDFQTWWGPSSSGKAQPYDAIVQTPQGPTQIGRLNAGDRVLDVDGLTSEVIAVHERGKQPLYRVEFNDGTFVDCAGDHLWEVDKPIDKWRRPKVMQTRDIAAMGEKASNLRIPLCKPVYHEKRKILIDPYILGVLLGDGSMGGKNGQSSLTLTCADDQLEIIDEFRSRLKAGYSLKKYNRYGYRLTKESGLNNGTNDYIRALKEYGLWSLGSLEKFIPEDYLYNEEPVRWAILAGLMDTDGFCGKNGEIVFSSISKALADGVCSIVRSLGGIARISTKSPWYRNKDGARVDGSLCYNVRIRLPEEQRLFYSSKKKSRVRDRSKGLTKYIKRVVDTRDEVEMRCITIDHPRGLYLTNDYIATHNSTDAGILALCMWLAAPHETTVMVCSTDKKALEQRIWREVVKYYKIRNDLPGELVRSKTSIFYDQEHDTLSGIFGIAVRQGTVDQAVSAIIGRHNKYVYLIIDEMQATLPAAVQAYDNLSSGREDGGFLGMGNPMNKLDPLGAHSQPIEGWEKLTTEKKEWKTKKGVCLYFDGLESPGVKDPKKFPFLLTQEQIDKMAHDPGENSPRFWTMRRGFMPPDGIIWAILNDKMIQQYHVKGRCDWASKPVRVAGIDPAYSAGGDKCILYPADVGREGGTGKWMIQFLEPIRINLQAKQDELMLDTLCNDIIKQLRHLGIAMKHVGMDTTGNQWMLADAVEKAFGQRGMLRVKFTGGATSDPISVQDPRPGSDLYQNFVTELWGRMGIYITNDMIRGLSDEACKQYSTRLLDFSTKDSKKVVIESKDILRDRLGYSPDEGDAGAIVIEVVRKVLSILPEEGSGGTGSATNGSNYEILALHESNMLAEDGFTGDEFAAVTEDESFFSDISDIF